MVVEDLIEGENKLQERPDAEKKKPNPVGDAVRLSGRSLEQKFDLKLKALRPVYLTEDAQKRLPFAAAFVQSGTDAWNEIQPFARGDRAGRATYVPKFEPTKEGDPKKETKAAERRGPFPVAVAVDGPLPAEWFEKDAKAIPSERLVVFGHGGVFVGTELKPAQEKLLLHSANWLLNRADRLPAVPEKEWSYPRVQLSERDVVLWRGGAAILLPLGVVVLGLLNMMLRRTR